MHAAIELAFGILVMASPLVFGFGVAGSAVALMLGALLVGLALAAASTEGQSGMSISSHAAADAAISIAMLVAGSVLALMGDVAAFAFLALAGAAQLALHANTRYSARPA
jgi:hypothetical protein